MTWQDRDYLDENYVGRASLWSGIRRPPKATRTLMLLHVVAFVTVVVLNYGVEGGARLVAPLALSAKSTQPIGVLLHPLATANFLSVLFTVLGLWWIGGRLEDRLGIRGLLKLYVIGTLFGGIAYLALARTAAWSAALPLDYPAGAFAAMIAISWRELRHEPTIVFGRPTSVSRVFLVCAGLAVALTMIVWREGAVAWLAACAAGAAAAPLVSHWPLLRRRRVRPSIHKPAPADEVEIDDVLAKISRSGLDSLTRRERRRLEAARRAKLRSSR